MTAIYIHFFPGQLIEDTGPSKDIDFIELTLRIGFKQKTNHLHLSQRLLGDKPLWEFRLERMSAIWHQAGKVAAKIDSPFTTQRGLWLVMNTSRHSRKRSAAEAFVAQMRALLPARCSELTRLYLRYTRFSRRCTYRERIANRTSGKEPEKVI